MFEETRSILEPAGALALAGAKAYCQYYGIKDKAVVAVTSGANMNFDRLRIVTELADVGAHKEAVLVTFMPEERGSFKKFAEMVSKLISLSPFSHCTRPGVKVALSTTRETNHWI
jgi:threonine dehydratase